MKLPDQFRYTTDSEEEALSDAVYAALNAELIDLYRKQVGVSPASLLSILVRFMAHFTNEAPEEIRRALIQASVTTYVKMCGGMVIDTGGDEMPSREKMN